MEDRLQKFARLVEIGNFTKASAELHISQPALSLSIAKLERELRSPLLVRGSRSLQLTAAGHAAYRTAKEMQVTTANLRTRLAELASEETALAIGMIDSVADILFTTDTVLTEVERTAHVSIVVNNSRYLADATTRDALDIAYIVSQPSVLLPGTRATVIGNEPLVLVAHPAMADALQHELERGIVSHFISYDQPSTTHACVQHTLQQYGMQPDTEFYSTSPTVMLRLVAMQKGVAALPYQLVREQLQKQALTLIGGKHKEPLTIHRQIAAVTRKGKVQHAACERLTEYVASSLQVLEAEISAIWR